MKRKLGGVKTSFGGGQPWWIWPRQILTTSFRNHPFIGVSEIQATDLVVGKTPKDGGDCISESPPKKMPQKFSGLGPIIGIFCP